MRYIMMILMGLLLMACNLSTPSNSVPLEATPTAVPGTGSQELGNITFWQSFPINEVTPSDDDIVIIEQIVLRRMESDTPRTGMPILDLEWALTNMLASSNVWTANDVSIESLSIGDGLARIELTGNISAVGGAILSMIPLQMQLTVFEESSIDSMLMTLNGENIANLGVAHSSQAVAGDYVFSREALYTELGRTP